MIDDEELRGIFKTTSEEHLNNLDAGLLQLEQHSDNQMLLESLLREAHSLKGDANMLGARDIGTLAHQVEYVLTQLKQHQIIFSQELGDRLAQVVTAMQRLVHEAVTGEPAGIEPFRILAALMGGEAAQEVEEKTVEQAKATVVEASPTSPPEPDQKQESARLPNTGASSPAKPAAAKPHCPPAYTPSTYRIETIRVPTSHLDSLMTQVGELTVTKIRIAHRLAEIEEIADLWDEWSREQLNHGLQRNRLQSRNGALFADPDRRSSDPRWQHLEALINQLRDAFYEDTKRLELLTNELAEGICNLRLLPLATIFNLFPRMVHDLARQEGKQVKLTISGEDTRADKRILEEMKDPLMHLLRNAIDHGIEPPDERVRLGKPPLAQIHLRSYQTPSHIVIEIKDDGCGLNVEHIRQTALKREICRKEELATMTDSQLQALIFTPGFSTAPLVTEVSGRGVGLDVVQTNVERCKGTIQVESVPGQGCLFRIQLGITLATAHVLIVLVNRLPYAIPVEFVYTACLLDPEAIFTIDSCATILWEGRPISIAHLANLLELPTGTAVSPIKQRQLACLILQVGQEQLGLIVDDVVDEQDVVIKPQSRLLKRVRNISGATILGTGEVCMVLNPQDLIKSVQRQISSVPLPKATAAVPEKQTILLVEDSIAARTQEKRMLEAAGYNVITAVDGNDGFTKLGSYPVDAVVSDIQMPNLDGLQLTSKIRQHQDYSELPIVLVTSLASDEDKRRGAEAGANAYITKNNLNQSVLLETLQRLI